MRNHYGWRRLRASKPDWRRFRRSFGIRTTSTCAAYFAGELHRVQTNPWGRGPRLTSCWAGDFQMHPRGLRADCRSRSQISNHPAPHEGCRRWCSVGSPSSFQPDMLVRFRPSQCGGDGATCAARGGRGLSVRATEELVALHESPSRERTSRGLACSGAPLSRRFRPGCPMPSIRVKVTRGAKKGASPLSCGRGDLARRRAGSGNVLTSTLILRAQAEHPVSTPPSSCR